MTKKKTCKVNDIAVCEVASRNAGVFVSMCACVCVFEFLLRPINRQFDGVKELTKQKGWKRCKIKIWTVFFFWVKSHKIVSCFRGVSHWEQQRHTTSWSIFRKSSINIYNSCYIWISVVCGVVLLPKKNKLWAFQSDIVDTLRSVRASFCQCLKCSNKIFQLVWTKIQKTTKRNDILAIGVKSLLSVENTTFWVT